MSAPVRRPTIRDIALAAGVSKASVSYALNGGPGVSAATRERVLAVAAQLGWRPSAAARSLSHARAHAVGLALARDVRLLGEEPYYMRFISGMEAVLAAEGTSLLLTVVPDVDTAVEVLRTWWAERRVDGVVLTDLLVDDPRLAAVRETGVPCVLRGGPGDVRGPQVAAAPEDHRQAFTDVVEHLLARGHRRLARVSGPPSFAHTRRRDEAWARVTARLVGRAEPVVVADYSGAGGVAAVRDLLTREHPPTAVVFDNDVMAATVVAERAALGVSVPGDLAVVAGDDSLLCRLATPAITSLRRDVVADGAVSARLLLDLLAGRDPGPVGPGTRDLVVRAST
ncbi:LacI family DNA-binding transcriptional regulator [Kineococcus terrestris]|uniref:LacI family DNA-binding transcriptional regulator n=1 Tax=Kineococcus terrestris TaxID=2044856 RepID=UPI0034DAC9F3